MSEAKRPLPQVGDDDRPFWEAARRHQFVLPRCRACGHTWFPPYSRCTRCLSDDREFVPASGRGTVWGVIAMEKPYIEAFAHLLPYNVALIQLEEGPKMFSNIVGIADAEIRVDMPVEVVFEDVGEGFSLPKFRPAG